MYAVKKFSSKEPWKSSNKIQVAFEDMPYTPERSGCAALPQSQSIDIEDRANPHSLRKDSKKTNEDLPYTPERSGCAALPQSQSIDIEDRASPRSLSKDSKKTKCNWCSGELNTCVKTPIRRGPLVLDLDIEMHASDVDDPSFDIEHIFLD